MTDSIQCALRDAMRQRLPLLVSLEMTIDQEACDRSRVPFAITINPVPYFTETMLFEVPFETFFLELESMLADANLTGQVA
jgi:hypothetical protein